MGRTPASIIEAANGALLGDGDLEAVATYFTPDYVVHLTDRDMGGGHGAIRGFVEKIRQAFPDLRVEVEVLVEGPDRVAWQRTLRGTHEGDFMGFPATGREIVWRDMMTSLVRDGRIAEEWAVSDLAERLLLARKG